VAAWLFVAGAGVGLFLLLVCVNALAALGAFGVFALVPVFYSLYLYKRLEKEGRLGNGTPAQG
jgi:hypothetical protein